MPTGKTFLIHSKGFEKYFDLNLFVTLGLHCVCELKKMCIIVFGKNLDVTAGGFYEIQPIHFSGKTLGKISVYRT